MAKKAVKKVQARVKRVAKKVVKRAVKQAVRVALPAVNKALAPAGLKVVQTANKRLVGEISHFFDKISVGVIEVKDTIKAGDKISIEGPQTNFTQTVASMQIEHDKIDSAKKGQSVGMKVAKEVRKKDLVYRLI
ncbi:MAG: U32 family peptidase C-terminal domain-containing protein [DPANN group archaeon]|nr:U32 family peptidase C-terminal domain-containing protein [DPANN group archaeon]